MQRSRSIRRFGLDSTSRRRLGSLLATLRNPNSPWLYSDLPVAGTPGLLYQDMRFTPPGPHFLNIRPAATPKEAASATAGESRSLC